MNRVNWYGCYDGSWSSAPLVAEAYAHPAKVSFNLAERIYRHMLAEGWLAPGDVVVDPFGGVGGFAFHAALYGMHWRGMELEQKFVDLGGQNLELWRKRYAPHFSGYGSAVLAQGDSRRLMDVLAGAGGIVSSPPYADAVNAGGEGPGMAGNAARRSRIYAGTQTENAAQSMGIGYGQTPGQLGAMPAGVVTSPPYAAGTLGAGDGPNSSGERHGMESASETAYKAGNQYGNTPGNFDSGNLDTFWSAASIIVAQCYAILKPGGYAAWVCGDFVRSKRRVPFGEQWLALCEAVGFEPVLWATAWKAESHGEQMDIFGNGHEQGKSKVSFFRRLANNKSPETAIVNEDVIFVRKPA